MVKVGDKLDLENKEELFKNKISGEIIDDFKHDSFDFYLLLLNKIQIELKTYYSGQMQLSIFVEEREE